MRKRVFTFTQLTFSVEPTKWKRTDEYRYISLKEFTRTKQGNIPQSKHDFFSHFVRLSAQSSHQRTWKRKSPVHARGDTGERAGYGEIQGHMQRVSKPGHPDKKLHAGGSPINIWSFSVGNKSLGESLQAFFLAGDLGSPSVISFNLEIAFAPEGEKIRLPITEVLLCAAAGDLKGSKKQRDWQSLNAVLLPLFLTEVAILHGELDVGEPQKIFARSITEWASDTAPPSEANEASNDDSVVTVEAPEASEGKNSGKPKASAETSATEARKPG